MYLIFGILTTLVDYIAAMCCFGLLDLGELTSNNIAWVVSVLFAFITNKLFVFDSTSPIENFHFSIFWSMNSLAAERTGIIRICKGNYITDG